MTKLIKLYSNPTKKFKQSFSKSLTFSYPVQAFYRKKDRLKRLKMRFRSALCIQQTIIPPKKRANLEKTLLRSLFSLNIFYYG